MDRGLGRTTGKNRADREGRGQHTRGQERRGNSRETRSREGRRRPQREHARPFKPFTPGAHRQVREFDDRDRCGTLG